MIKILIVEDEKPISDMMVMSLKLMGYECTALYNGIDAANLLEEDQNFDLILLDIMLPEINGYELMEYIRPMGIPVIFITAKASLDDRIKGLTSGAEDYIIKPFDMVELRARINIMRKKIWWHCIRRRVITHRHCSTPANCWQTMATRRATTVWQRPLTNWNN